MNWKHCLPALVLAYLTACTVTKTTSNQVTPVTTVSHPKKVKPPKDKPESVIVIYHVRPGMENDLAGLLAKAWGMYESDHLVHSQPHMIVRDPGDNGKTRFVEIFTWVSHAAPEHVPPDVQDIWSREMADCEPRDGHPGLDGGEVDIVTK